MRKLMIIALTALTLVTGVNADAKTVKVDGAEWEVTTTKKEIVAESVNKVSAKQAANFDIQYVIKAYKEKKDITIEHTLKKGISKKAADKVFAKKWAAYEDEEIGLVSVAGIQRDPSLDGFSSLGKVGYYSEKKHRDKFANRLAYRRVVRRFYDDNNGFAGMSEFDKTYAAIELVQKGCYYMSSYNQNDNGGWIKFENAVYNGGRKLGSFCQGGSEMAAILMESTGLSKGSCGVATSDDLNHAWNFLMIEGKMYFASWQDSDISRQWEGYQSVTRELDDSLLDQDIAAAKSMSRGLYGWTYAERDNSSLYKQTDTEYHCVVKNGKHVGYSNAWMSGHEDKAHKLTYKK